MLASALEDEATLDRGLVLVAWNGESPADSGNPAAALSSLWGAAPGGPFDSFWGLWRSVRSAFPISRLHYCVPYDQSAVEASYSLKETQETHASAVCVVRHHQGSPQECLHALMTHGLPMPALPISLFSSSPDTKHYLAWIEWRQRTDSYHYQRSWRIILVPTREDILFGHHTTVNAGNVRFHQMILSNVEEYRGASDAEKESIRSQIYKSLSSSSIPGTGGSGGRFLQPLDPKRGILWEPMEEHDASVKIDHAFEFVAAQIDQVRSSDPNAKGVRATDVWDFGDPYYFTRQCFALATCQRGGSYGICGGGSSGERPGCWQLLSVTK